MRLFAVVLLVAFSFINNFTYAAESRSHNDGDFCPLVCKNSVGHGSGGSSITIVYLSKSETIIGFYDSSTGYAFLLDWKTQYFLTINVKSDASAIFSWSTGGGYYITSSVKAGLIYSGSGSRESVIAYFKSITSLKEVFNVYQQHGKSFSFNTLEGQAKVIIEGFIKATFSSDEAGSFSHGIKQWASFASLIYTTFSASLRGAGVYEIYASEKEIITFLLHHNGGGGGNNSPSKLLQEFLQILSQLGGNNSHFNNDDIEQLLRSIGINHPDAQLIGFLRFIELLTSLNISAASNANSNTSLTQFLLPNSHFSAHEFEEILRSIPGLERFLRIFIRFGGGGGGAGGLSWTSIFSSDSWGQIFSYIPGLQQFIQFVRHNPGFGGFLKLGETFADGVKDFAKNVQNVANSFPIPNPIAPIISGFAGGVEGVASQFSNGFHLVDGLFGGGSNGSESNESRKKV